MSFLQLNSFSMLPGILVLEVSFLCPISLEPHIPVCPPSAEFFIPVFVVGRFPGVLRGTQDVT